MKIQIIENANGSATVICPHCGDEIYIERYNMFECIDDDNFYYIKCSNKHKLFWDKDFNLIDNAEVCEHCGRAFDKKEFSHIEEQKFIAEGITLCNDCKKEYKKQGMLIKIDYEMKNDNQFLDNHPEIKIYCPFCGDEISNNRFSQIGQGNSFNSGTHCDKCNVDVFTYKIEICK